MSRSREHLLKIIGNQADLIERLANMVGDHPLYLAVAKDMRREMQLESLKAAAAGKRVVAEEAAAAGSVSSEGTAEAQP